MPNRDHLAFEIAVEFYKKNKTQTQIAKDYHISRPTVAKLLEEAKEKGIVTINIQHPQHYYHTLQKNIFDKYSLSGSVLISSFTNSIQQNKINIGNMCSKFLKEIIRETDYQSLGIGWGTTIYEFVKSMEYIDTSIEQIVPLMGGVGLHDIKYHANHLAFQLAEKLNADTTYFYAPAIAENDRIYKLFIESDLVKSIIDIGRHVDVAIVGLGNPIKSSTYRDLGYISSKDILTIDQSGAIGDILATFFNKLGEPVETPISNRMIGLSMDDLKNIPQVILLATGDEKLESLDTILKLNIISDLIIDSELASNLINY